MTNLERTDGAFTTSEILAANSRHDRLYEWDKKWPSIYGFRHICGFVACPPVFNSDQDILDWHSRNQVPLDNPASL